MNINPDEKVLQDESKLHIKHKIKGLSMRDT